MTHYIDKDAVVAEIERRLYLYDPIVGYEEGRKDEAKSILSFINTLEVKEVDLEKEIEFLKEYYKEGNVEWNGDFDFIARHFFELRLNTSEEIKIGETQIYLEDDGGEPPYDGKQWLDLSCTEYEIPVDKFKDGDKVELIIRKKQKGE